MFQLKNFSLHHEKSSLKIGTDSILLTCLIPLNHNTHILDIGCGCGIITLGLADRLQNSLNNVKFCGIDIDDASIMEANMNLSIFPHYELIDITFLQTSLQSHISHEPYDLIVSNPPYFCNSLKPDNRKNETSKHRDSNLSFFDLAHHVARLLTHSGTFWLILPVIEYAKFCKEAALQGLYPCHEYHIIPNPRKTPNRVVAAFSKKNRTATFSTLTIRDMSNQYTAAYKSIVSLIQNPTMNKKFSANS